MSDLIVPSLAPAKFPTGLPRLVAARSQTVLVDDGAKPGVITVGAIADLAGGSAAGAAQTDAAGAISAYALNGGSHGVFAGSASSDMRKSFDTSTSTEHRTWVGQSDGGLMTYFDINSSLASIAGSGGLAIAASARTSEGQGGGAIGVGAYANADGTTATGDAWSYYGHSVRRAGATASSVITAEMNIANVGTFVPVSPYAMAPAGLTASLWTSSGGETAVSGIVVNPASVALGIVTNGGGMVGATYDKGIVFQAEALRIADAARGTAVAVQMAKGHELNWVYDGSVQRSGYIRSDGTGAGMGIVFKPAGVSFQDKNENQLALIDAAGAVQGSSFAATSDYLQLGTPRGETALFYTAPGGTSFPFFNSQAGKVTLAAAGAPNSNFELSANGTGIVAVPAVSLGNNSQAAASTNFVQSTIGAYQGQAVITPVGNSGTAVRITNGTYGVAHYIDSSAYNILLTVGGQPLGGSFIAARPLTIDLVTGAVSMAAGLAVSGNTGFFGSTPIAKPVVTGSRDTGAALASLLTALATLGLITDSTTSGTTTPTTQAFDATNFNASAFTATA